MRGQHPRCGLAAAYETIDTEFGGMDHYLAHELGLHPPERALLCHLYLEQ